MQRSPVTTKDLQRTPAAAPQRTLKSSPRTLENDPRLAQSLSGTPVGPCQGSRDARGFPRGPSRRPGDPLRTSQDPKTLPKDLRREPRGPLKRVQSVPYPGPETQAVGTLIALSPFALVLFCFASCSLFRTRTPFSLCSNQQTSFRARCPTKISFVRA